MKNDSQDKIKEELRKRIADFDKYNFHIEESDGIIAVQPVGPELHGYEVDVDTGGESFDRSMDELAYKVSKLIGIYKNKQNEK